MTTRTICDLGKKKAREECQSGPDPRPDSDPKNILEPPIVPEKPEKPEEETMCLYVELL